MMRSILFILMTLAALASADEPVVTTSPSSASRVVEVADELINRAFTVPWDSAWHVYKEAETLLEPAVRKYPKNSEVLARMAIVHAQLASWDDSHKAQIVRVQKVDHYSLEALKYDSLNTKALVIQGILNYRLSNLSWIERLVANTFIAELPEASWEISVKYLTRANRVYDRSPYYHFALGRTYRAMGEDEKALYWLQRAVELEPENEIDLRYQKRARHWLERINE